jgi:hypothetical protein
MRQAAADPAQADAAHGRRGHGPQGTARTIDSPSLIVAVTYLDHALHDGSPWVLLACLVIFAGVVVGLFTERGSGISYHPYTRPELGGQLASDLPPESIGRAELEPLLWGKRRARRPGAVKPGGEVADAAVLVDDAPAENAG